MGSATVTKGVALVTGGSRGIGRAAALRLSAAGLRVSIVRSGTRPDDEALRDEMLSVGAGGVQVLRLDVAEPEAAKQAVASVMEAWSRVDVLVNVAGVAVRSSLEDITPELLQKQFAINAFAPLWFSQAAAAVMRPHRSGRIVNVGSLATQYSVPGRSLYEASKAAAERFTRALARELAPQGIQVNGVSPGLVNTKAAQRALGPEFAARAEGLPIGRAAEPDEIASAIAYLALDAPKFLTGEIIKVDGGRTA